VEVKRLLVLWLYAMATAAGAQGGGGLYVAGGNFDFTQAVERALAQHPTPSKFFVLATADSVRGLSVVAPPELVEVCNRGAARGAVYLVCRRDIEREAFSLTWCPT
jgi:NAD(P)H-dependent flavin oxidoreductase YrpB (nitropropane dioxygenase family)